MKVVLVAALSAVIALAVGVGLGYAVGSGSGATSGEAADRAALACQGAEGLPAELAEGEDNLVELLAVSGVGSLAQAAGETDPAYAELGEAGVAVTRVIQTLDADGYPGAVEDLVAACDDL